MPIGWVIGFDRRNSCNGTSCGEMFASNQQLACVEFAQRPHEMVIGFEASVDQPPLDSFKFSLGLGVGQRGKTVGLVMVGDRVRVGCDVPTMKVLKFLKLIC